ncbi:hypothetical protein B0H34DRAFT_285825 [Crassisporium funariophilum]|nr:hypothetical protein B0H34DRAFT_285825 [Crassisporium funariophilum]
MAILHNAIAPGAFHNSGERYDPPKCHPSTRVAILRKIMLWVQDRDRKEEFLWLFGPAGNGKSAIAQTIAELCFAAHLLAASFFFSRTAAGRNNETKLIPTLAYQLCLSIPEMRNFIEETLVQNPSIITLSLEAQMQALIVGPLCLAAGEMDTEALLSRPRFIIIDGLDECGDAKIQRYILNVLCSSVKRLPIPIFFLIASRPEQQIRDMFESKLMTSMTSRLSLNDSSLPRTTSIYLLAKFEEIKETHPLRHLLPEYWPTASEIASLVKKSSGQFIYASTVAKYVDSPRHRPTDRLEVIFGLSDPENDTPFAELDALYTHIFSCIENVGKALVLIGSILVLLESSREITPDLIEDLLFLRRGDVLLTLGDLHSIINIPSPLSADAKLRIFHASLGDFLSDPTRSKQFHINTARARADLVRCYLKHVPQATVATLYERQPNAVEKRLHQGRTNR